VMPALILLARTRSYPWVRTAAAAFTATAAAAWIAERTLGVENPVGRAIDEGLAHGPWLLAVLVAGTVLAVLADRPQKISPPTV
jgi:hypothetical protein